MNTLVIFFASYLYLFILLAALIYFLLQPNAVKRTMAICGVVIAPLAYVISRISSVFYYDPRPFVVGHFAPLIAHVADNGFPSDHVLLTGAVAMIVWFFNKKMSLGLWLGAMLIGWARVYAGIHHWTDILGSVVIVLISGFVYHLFAVKKIGRLRKKRADQIL